jgi:hypothetical protein
MERMNIAEKCRIFDVHPVAMDRLAVSSASRMATTD